MSARWGNPLWLPPVYAGYPHGTLDIIILRHACARDLRTDVAAGDVYILIVFKSRRPISQCFETLVAGEVRSA